MWFLFILGPAIVGVAGALFSLTGGMNFVVAAVATNEWHRRRGYKPDEGQFTERANDAYYGVGFDKNTDYDLSRNLGLLAATLPSLFNPFVNKRFDFTKSEGEFLRSLLEPAMQAHEAVQMAQEAVLDRQDEESMQFLQAAIDGLGVVVVPVVRYLEQFPDKRVKDMS